MAFGTGNFLMPSVQPEGSLVVIKVRGLPALILMAPLAIRHSINIKLPVVVVGMTIIASIGQT